MADERKIEALQRKVDETKGVALDNITKLLDRSEKVEELKSQTFEMEDWADSIRQSSSGLARRKRCELYVWCGVGALIVFFIIAAMYVIWKFVFAGVIP